MKKIFFFTILIIIIFLVNCSKDDSNLENGFSVNGKNYNTNYAYIEQYGYKCMLIFSSADKYSSSYVENRGRFDLIYLIKGELTSDTYTISRGIDDTVEFTKDIQMENGLFTSLGTDLAQQTSGFSSIKSAKVSIHSLEFDNEGNVNKIDIDYSFDWDGINVRGSYNGVVRVAPEIR